MIQATSTPDGPFLTLNASVSGPVVYLDNWAIGDLAEGDISRRKRFIAAMHSGMDLLFSVTNAAELSGPQGRSADIVRTFLDEIGPRWVPVELSPTEVANRELGGTGGYVQSPCLSESFMKSYLVHLMRDYTPGSGKVINLSSDFFYLGAVLDWVGPQRESIRESSAEMDRVLGNKFVEVAAKSNLDAGWLDARFPRILFNSAQPAHFVYRNLSRMLIEEASAFKKGDGMDFCHAIMASAYGSFSTLDERWKRRVESLPTPNGLARIYSGSELDQMVTDMESWLAHRAAASTLDFDNSPKLTSARKG